MQPRGALLAAPALANAAHAQRLALLPRFQGLGLTIKQRLELLQNAEERWLENYRQSLADWSERNQFEAEAYDTSSALTPIQSRIEALRQKGMMDVAS